MISKSFLNFLSFRPEKNILFPSEKMYCTGRNCKFHKLIRGPNNEILLCPDPELYVDDDNVQHYRAGTDADLTKHKHNIAFQPTTQNISS